MHLAGELNSRQLAFVDIIERDLDPTTASNAAQFNFGYTPADFRTACTGDLMINGQYDRDEAETVAASGHAQMVGIGRPYMGTPDVAERFQAGKALNNELNAGY